MSKIIEIKDFNDKELDIYARLSEVELLKINHPATGIFIAESPKVIERAILAGYEPISFLVESKHIETEAKDILEKFPDTPVYTATFDVLTQLTGFKLTRGMLCAFKRKELPSLEELCKDSKRIAILDNVMNPTNIGAIFRSAAAIGMDTVLLTPGCSNPLYRRSARVSMGTVFQVPWTYIDNDYLSRLKEYGFKTLSMALSDNSISIDDPILKSMDKLAIILGTEGDGLSDNIITECDYVVKIPMLHNVDSLNVAAASAVAFWELRKH